MTKFIKEFIQDKLSAWLAPSNGLDTSKCYSRNLCAVGCFVALLILISGCALQDNFPSPKNFTPQTNITLNVSSVNNSVNNTVNATVVVPRDPVLLPVSGKLAVYVLDNANAGGYVVTLNKKSALINSPGGADGLRTLKVLKNLGIQHLDKFILTNSLNKNILGASQIILREYPVELIHSGIPSTDYLYKQYIILFPNATIVPTDFIAGFDDSMMQFIVPYDDGQPLTNDSSITLKLYYGNTNILFSTDCKIECESRITNSRLSSQILISNGACDSLSLAFLQQVNPQVVIFSEKPCDETLKRVGNLGIIVLSTPSEGDIVITSDGNTYEYKSLKTK